MIRNMAAGIILSGMLLGHASAASRYEGQWVGQLNDGTAVALSIPADIEKGGAADYTYGNEPQGQWSASKQGGKLRLTSPRSGSYLLIGPVRGSSMPYFWTNGTNKAATTMSRQ